MYIQLTVTLGYALETPGATGGKRLPVEAGKTCCFHM